MAPTKSFTPEPSLLIFPEQTTIALPVPPGDTAGASLVDCAPPQPPYIMNKVVLPVPPLDEPQPRIPYRDPTFGACLVRVTDRFYDLAGEDPSTGLKNEYSRVQSFNADGSYLLARGIEATWYLYDAHTLQPLRPLEFDGAVDPRWDATHSERLYYNDGANLTAYNVDTGEQWTVRDFSADFPDTQISAVWTRHEGSPSRDGQRWGFMVEDQDWLTAYYVIYDMKVNAVTAVRDLRDWPHEAREEDSVAISPNGNYFLAFMDLYCEPGELGTDKHPCGLMVYDRSLQIGRGLLRIVGHTDLALDYLGREVLVYQDIDTDHISMLDLETGLITALLEIDYSHSSQGFHFSGRSFQQPGWVLVSTHAGAQPSATWMDDQVFALELKPGGRVVRLAHTHSLVDENQEQDYWAEPHASVNPDFTRVVFTTNWGRSGTTEVEMFMILLPPGWLDALPVNK